MMDVSVIIPSRQEEFLGLTMDNVLANIEADTEIIAICDGSWPDPPIKDHPRVTLIHHTEPIGQRAAVNEGAKISQAKYMMKLDAHCTVSSGFDKALMEICQPDWTIIPRMFTLEAFRWVCKNCGIEYGQGPPKQRCDRQAKYGIKEPCGGTEFERKIIFERTRKATNFMFFDNDLIIGYVDRNYLRKHGNSGQLKQMMRPRMAKLKKDLKRTGVADTMVSVGACWFMERQRFLDLGGLDEAHGFWGQVAVEIACKAWLSGGRQVTTNKAWFAHLFRTQNGFSFPYPNEGPKQARKYSRKLWHSGTWEHQVRPLSWLVEHFKPVAGWHQPEPTKELIYYTDNYLNPNIMAACIKQLKEAYKANNISDKQVISVSHKPLDFGRNIVMPDLPRSSESIFRQILAGLEKAEADIIYLIEHDILYHPSHFDFIPPKPDRFYYNLNFWFVNVKTGHCLKHFSRNPSFLAASRELLLKYYRRIVQVIDERGFHLSEMGYTPGARRIKGVGNFKTENWESEYPNLDLREHGANWSPKKWRKQEFRNEIPTQGWQEADKLPNWYIERKGFLGGGIIWLKNFMQAMPSV